MNHMTVHGAVAPKMETIPFHGAHIEAVRAGETVWVSVRRMCEALGLDTSSQHKKLYDRDRSPWAVTVMMTTTGPDGKNYESFCLDLESVPMWLATIDTSRVAEHVRPKVILFQREAAKVLRDHFFGPRVVVEQRSATAELRLANSARRLELEHKKLVAKSLQAVSKALREDGRNDVALVFDVKVAEMAAGQDFSFALPASKTAEWKSPTQIVNESGRTMHEVSTAISRLGIRGDIDGVAKPVVNKARGHNREVTSFIYSPEAIVKILEEIERNKIPVVANGNGGVQ